MKILELNNSISEVFFFLRISRTQLNNWQNTTEKEKAYLKYNYPNWSTERQQHWESKQVSVICETLSSGLSEYIWISWRLEKTRWNRNTYICGGGGEREREDRHGGVWKRLREINVGQNQHQNKNQNKCDHIWLRMSINALSMKYKENHMQIDHPDKNHK